MRRIFLALLLVAMALPLGATPAFAADQVVDADGMATFGSCNDTAPTNDTVQEGVDAASPTDTVRICPGTYTEDVDITKSITLEGVNRDGTVIKAPSPVPESSCEPGSDPDAADANRPIVEVCGAGVEVIIRTLTVSGPEVGQSCTEFDFIGVWVTGSASLDATSVDVEDIRNNPLDGCQQGTAVMAGSFGSSGPGDLQLRSSTLRRYQKTGVSATDPDSDVTIEGNQILGVGATEAIAQNGVQLTDGVNATVTNNNITGHLCNVASCGPDEQFESAGVIALDWGELTVDDNDLSQNDIGVATIDDDFDVADATDPAAITNNRIFSRYEGLYLFQGTVNASGNIIRFATNAGVILASAEGDLRDTVANFTGVNQVGANDTGFRIVDFDADSSDDSFEPRLTANRNRITNNGDGIENQTTVIADAKQNWWNSPTGPSDWGTGAGDSTSQQVDFFPWSTNFATTTFRGCDSGPTAGNNVLCGNGGNNTINGNAGDDLILGRGGNDTLGGQSGDDALIGEQGNDTLNGGSGFDSLQGRQGFDPCNVGVDGGQDATCEAPPMRAAAGTPRGADAEPPVSIVR